MITYKNCSDVTITQMYEAFSKGFSDYFFPLTMKEKDFEEHFMGPEGNKREYSFLAFEDDQPIGIILGGIRNLDGIRTMRCGTLGLSPEYRGKGVSLRLYELHKETAIKEACSQLFLEVIKENHRAVAFYKKLGYLESVILKYYSSPSDSIPSQKKTITYPVSKVLYKEIKEFRNSLKSCHINWQNDTPFYENSNSDLYLKINDKDKLVGMLAMAQSGKLNFLWIEPEYRLQGIGHHLLMQAVSLIKPEKISVCIPGNALLEGFLRKLNFTKGNIEQYEMHLPL